MKQRTLKIPVVSAALLPAVPPLCQAHTQAQGQIESPPQSRTQATDRQPNIIVIMGDDIGWFYVGAYHRGIMASRIPNLDKMAAEGMRFTDYYAEASCTAGRATFITGELPIRTGQTPFAGGKGTALAGGFRVPAILRWPGKVPAGRIENGIMSGMDWFPEFLAAAGHPNIAAELKKGKQLGDRTYKIHLDGYDQTALIMGKGPSARHEIIYFTESTLSAVRIDDYKYRFTDQPNGRLGGRCHGEAR